MSIINNETNTICLNDFSKIPYVKIHSATFEMTKFIYSGLKGAFIFMRNSNDEGNMFVIRIYSLKTFLPVFEIEIEQGDIKKFKTSSDNFFSIQLKSGYLGFEFLSQEYFIKRIQEFATKTDESLFKETKREKE